MQITWYGQRCFKIQTKPKRGEKAVTIVTDPFSNDIGLRPPQGQSDIITFSTITLAEKQKKNKKNQAFIIDSAGEYSLKGVTIEGVESFQDEQELKGAGRNNIFVIKSEDINLCHLGQLGEDLTEDQIETLGAIDILLIPVGRQLSIKKIKNIIGQLEPAIIVPMDYKIKGLQEKVESCDTFCQEFGGNRKEARNKLTIKSNDLKDMENNVVILKRS